MIKPPDNSGFLENVKEDEAAEWSFRSLVKSLLRSDRDASESQVYARKLLEAGAEGMLRRIAAIADANDRIEAYGDAEMLIEASLRIALYEHEIADDAICGSEQNRIRKLHISALQAMYTSDPVERGLIGRKELRAAVAERLGLSIEKIDLKTLDRARKDVWKV